MMTREELEYGASIDPLASGKNNSASIKTALSREELERGAAENPSLAYDNYSLPESIGRNTAAILGSAGRDIINTPRNLLNLVPGINNQNNPVPAYEPNYDYYKAMGVQPSTSKSLAQGIVEFGAPLGAASKISSLGGIPKISEGLQTNLLAGGIGGAAADPNHPYAGLAEGTAIGGIAHGLGLAGSTVANAAANLYAKTALPGLVSRGTSAFAKTLRGSDATVSPLKDAHDAAATNETLQWQNANDKAAELDNNLMRPDPSPYLDYVNDFIKQKSALEPAIRSSSEEALDFAKTKALDLTPQSYQGAVALRQGLNENIQDYLKMRNKDAPSRGLNSFVKGLKSTLDEVVNPEGSPQPVQDFYNSWQDANKATQRKEEFYLTPDKNGMLQYNRGLENALKNTNPDASIIGNFVPKAGQTGISGLNQLTNLVGDKDTAANMINSYAARQLPTSGKLTKTAADYYSALSPEQRTALVSDNPYLKTANDVMLNYKDPATSWDWGDQGKKAIWTHFLPMAAGYGGAHYVGLNPWEAAAIAGGIGGATTLGRIGLWKFATPNSVQRAMAYGRTPANNPGNIANPFFSSINYGAHQNG